MGEKFGGRYEGRTRKGGKTSPGFKAGAVASYRLDLPKLAEETGFEPAVAIKPHSLSKRAP